MCNGNEWVPFYDEEGTERYKPCVCREKSIKSNRLKFANIPDTYKNFKLGNFNIETYKEIRSRGIAAIACKTIKYYLDNFNEMQARGMGLYLHSDTKGSGKTRMAASIANFLLEEHQVKFAVSTVILREIQYTWSKDSEYTESKILNDLTNSEILIIDDFGTEKSASWINDKFYHIVNERYINKKVTIFTSNFELNKLDYDVRITNRIKENTYQIAFPEESIREHIAKRNNQEMLENLKG